MKKKKKQKMFKKQVVDKSNGDAKIDDALPSP